MCARNRRNTTYRRIRWPRSSDRIMRSGPQQSPFQASKIGSGDKQNQANHHATLATFGIVLTGRLGLRNELLSTFSVVGKDVWDEYARACCRDAAWFRAAQPHAPPPRVAPASAGHPTELCACVCVMSRRAQALLCADPQGAALLRAPEGQWRNAPARPLRRA